MKERDVFVRIRHMHVINIKREKNKDQQSCLLGFPIIAVFILCHLMCSFRVWCLGRMWNSIASVLIIALLFTLLKLALSHALRCTK